MAAAASISTDETHSSVLLRPRNFQWCWNSAINPCSGEEQWQKIDDGYIIDFEHQVQYNKTDKNRQCSIQLYDLNEGCSNIRLREER
jgi:hypothetical protein